MYLVAAPVTLVIIGLASAWLYYWGQDLHRFTQWIAAYIWLYIAHFGFYLIACYAVLRSPARLPRFVTLATVLIVIAFAVIFRLQLVDERPYLSSDTYRYIWDGRVQAAGVNPYRYIPSAPELAHLRDEKIYPLINRADYAPTPYPPIAQAVYFLVQVVFPSSVTGFKVAMSLFDIITIVAVMLALARAGFNPARAVIFAWHPLLIWEGAHSGHIESAFICFLALALLAWSYRKPVLVGVALGLATMVKFYPALVLPAFMYSHQNKDSDDGAKPDGIAGWLAAIRSTLFSRPNLWMLAAFVGTIILAYLPYLSVGAGVLGYLPRELQEEGYEGGTRYFLFALIRQVAPVPAMAFTVFAALALIGMGLWRLTRDKRGAADVARGAIALIGLFLLLSTPRYPWYFAWLLPYLCFAPRIGWLYLTGATILLYLLWYTPNVYPHLPLWLGASLYAPTLAFLFWEWMRERQKSGAALAGADASP
ncbi:MAG TPA: hypothetical protein VNO70_05410 [Blastocatellia bacterium]|nr:hypothetical protein [Blastocatellia bacterium]